MRQAYFQLHVNEVSFIKVSFLLRRHQHTKIILASLERAISELQLVLLAHYAGRTLVELVEYFTHIFVVLVSIRELNVWCVQRGRVVSCNLKVCVVFFDLNRILRRARHSATVCADEVGSGARVGRRRRAQFECPCVTLFRHFRLDFVTRHDENLQAAVNASYLVEVAEDQLYGVPRGAFKACRNQLAQLPINLNAGEKRLAFVFVVVFFVKLNLNSVRNLEPQHIFPFGDCVTNCLYVSKCDLLTRHCKLDLKIATLRQGVRQQLMWQLTILGFAHEVVRLDERLVDFDLLPASTRVRDFLDVCLLGFFERIQINTHSEAVKQRNFAVGFLVQSARVNV